MTEQGYNYLDRSIQEISSFFETKIENLVASALPPAVKKPPKKKKKGSSRKQKASSYEDSKRNPQAERNSASTTKDAVNLWMNAPSLRP